MEEHYHDRFQKVTTLKEQAREAIKAVEFPPLVDLINPRGKARKNAMARLRRDLLAVGSQFQHKAIRHGAELGATIRKEYEGSKPKAKEAE